MRLSLAVLALVLGGVPAFVPSIPRGNSHGATTSTSSLLSGKAPPPEFPTPKVTSETPISSDTDKMKNIMEARGCLLEIESAAERAREYLVYLEEVAEVVRAYVENQSSVPLQAAPELANVEMAKEYLVNIEKATSSATEYLAYLEEMAFGIKTYLHKFEQQYQAGGVSEKGVHQAEEAKIHMQDLEETSEAARNYLKYLQNIASVVQQYLVDPNLKGIEEFMPPEQPAGLKSMGDFMGAPEEASSARATHVIGTHPKPKVQPPPARALEVDETTGPQPVKRIAALPTDTVEKSFDIASESVELVAGDYLASLRSSSTTPPTTVSSGNMAYLDSIAANPAVAGIQESGGIQGYLDSIAPSLEKRIAESTKPSSGGGYLDTINDPPPERLPGSTPTSHFKESADSTPFAEAGPPGRGRSDVSHMDSMGPSYLDTMNSADSSPPPTSSTQNAAPTTSSYLDKMTSASTTTAPGKQAAPTSYLDQMSSTTASPPLGATKKETPPSYLDQMSAPAEPVDWSQVKGPESSEPAEPSTPAPPVEPLTPAPPVESVEAQPKATTSTASYLDQMSSLASAPPTKAAATTTTSYLDQMSSTGPSAKPKPAMPAAGSSYLDQINPSTKQGGKLSAPGSGMPSYLSQMESTGRLEPKHFTTDESVDEFFSSKQQESLDREDGEPIPAKLPFLGAQYMGQLQQAADKNPLNLRDELGKRAVPDTERWEEKRKEGSHGASLLNPHGLVTHNQKHRPTEEEEEPKKKRPGAVLLFQRDSRRPIF